MFIFSHAQETLPTRAGEAAHYNYPQCYWLNVQRIITLHLHADRRPVGTIETVNKATNDILVIGFEAVLVNKRERNRPLLGVTEVGRLMVNEPNVESCLNKNIYFQAPRQRGLLTKTQE